jgi:hypothetical protein
MRRPRLAEAAWLGALGIGVVGVGVGFADPVPTTPEDFFQGGSQPLSLTVKLTSTTVCSFCHGFFDETTEPLRLWASSMMGQSARDPIFHAARAIANQDAADIGAFCNRCHVPQGFMSDRHLPTDGSNMTPSDFEGVSCSTCHRMVDPIYQEGISPMQDQAILAALPNHPVNPGNASYIFDPQDRRRGPYALAYDFHPWIQAQFQRSSQICATCHEVSNPAFTRQSDGSFVANTLNLRHPTGNKFDMFPEQRTYSEWAMSSFATTPQPLGARYGTNQANVQSCQDCHMPRTTAGACDPSLGPTIRNDYAKHTFNGSNTWVLKAVRELNPDDATLLEDGTLAAALERTQEMLRDASDLELAVDGSQLRARIVNQTGHKLPTGYPEGRRMWVNVKFLNAAGDVVAERGAYNSDTATLSTDDTKVYEAKFEISPASAAVFSKPAGPYLGLIPVDTITKDNRIPPRGFTNANFNAVQAGHFGYSYADGQYWDDTLFDIPAGATRAEVRTFYQTTSREYIEFLRDANTGGPGNAGEIAYAQWLLHGKSAPAEMDVATIQLTCPADLDDGSGTGAPDGGVDINDLIFFLVAFENGTAGADLDDGTMTGTPDQAVTIDDMLYYLVRFEMGC